MLLTDFAERTVASAVSHLPDRKQVHKRVDDAGYS
jgi:hypothetical protein